MTKKLINLTDQIRQKSGIEIRSANDGAIALNLNNENYYSLDHIAYQIYQELVSAPSIDSALQNLTKVFDVNPKELETDVLVLAQDLYDQQFLEVIVD